MSYRVERIEDSLRGKVPLYISPGAARRSLLATRDERYVPVEGGKKEIGRGWIVLIDYRAFFLFLFGRKNDQFGSIKMNFEC